MTYAYDIDTGLVCKSDDCHTHLERDPHYRCGGSDPKQGCNKYFCDFHLFDPIGGTAHLCARCLGKSKFH